MIALFLTALILTALFRFFSQVTKVEQEIETAKIEVYQSQHLHVLGQQVFSQILPSALLQEKTSSFYTPDDEKQLLCVLFDHGIDPDPLFSGPLFGHFILNQEGQFLFEIFPIDNKEESRKKLLAKDIKNVSFKFFDTDSLTWQSHWPKKKEKLPSMLHLTVKEKNKAEKSFAFFLPSAYATVTYRERDRL